MIIITILSKCQHALPSWKQKLRVINTIKLAKPLGNPMSMKGQLLRLGRLSDC